MRSERKLLTTQHNIDASTSMLAREFHNWLRDYYPRNKTSMLKHTNELTNVHSNSQSLFTQNEHIEPIRIASQSSPIISIFRANPYSEVTDLICRLPLPTLFYRLETLHLGDQLRILVRPVEKFTRDPTINFQGPRRKYRHNSKCHALLVHLPYLSAKDFHGNTTMKQKRKLFRYLSTASLWSLLLPG